MKQVARLFILALGAALAFAKPASAQGTGQAVDLALVLAVDISNSMDATQFQLQMAGLSQAFEDQAVQDAIVSGRHGRIIVTLVAWSDKPRIAIPWTPLGNELEAFSFAETIRDLPRIAGNFTCMSDALNFVSDRVLPLQPVPAERQIVDVSGDGRENCNPRKPLDAVRSELVAKGVTINGLPILEGAEADLLEQWYMDNVIGGPFAFVLPAQGYNDFARAIRRKFLVEISRAIGDASGALGSETGANSLN